MKNCLIYLFALFNLWAELVQAQAPVAATINPATATEIRQRTFEQVWRTIKDKHFDPTLGGLDWDKVRARYAPQIAAAPNDAAFYALLGRMIGELHQTHFQIIPPEAVIEQNDDGPHDGETGLRVQILSQQVVIVAVTPASPAARAGLQPGFIITRINDKPIAPLLQKVAASQSSDAIKRLLLERQLFNCINGAPGTSVVLNYLDGKNRAATANVTRQRVTREMSPAFGNFGPQPIDFEARRLPSGFGYICFNIWVMPMLEKMRTALQTMADTPGIIFDVRGNPGGVGGLASGISGHLFTVQTVLGKTQMRSGYNNYVAFPQSFVYRGALVVLTDHGSASTSEIFAAGLQDAGRAVVIGERTAGAALPSVIEKLPTGALFQYAIGDFKTPQGTLVEGRGVIPNVVALHTRTTLLAGRDVQLEAAIVQLQRQLRKPPGTAKK